MSRFGKKMVAIGIWAGIGVLVGLQFGGSSGGASESPVPGWSVVSGNVQNTPVSQQQPGTVTGLQVQSDGKGGYIYVPVTIPATSAPQEQATVPQQPVASAVPSAPALPQQPVGDYSTLTPGQILVPQERRSTVDEFADKTAGLLQQASQKSIRWVVSLFDSAE